MRVRNLLIFIISCACNPYVTVEKDENGVWWLLQNGEKFVSQGVNHINNGGQDDGVGGIEAAACKKETKNPLCGDLLNFSRTRNFSPYFNTTMDKYGSEDAWASATVKRLTQWGFNTAGGYSATIIEKELSNQNLYYVHLLNMCAQNVPNSGPRGGCRHDLWSEDFAKEAMQIAKNSVAPRSTDPHLIGWQFDNELHDDENTNNVGLEFYLGSLGPGFKVAFAFIQKQYNGSLTAFNVAWGTNCTSWEQAPRAVQGTGGVKEDRLAWNNIVIRQYFNVSTHAVKTYDTNHLIIGLRGTKTDISDGQNDFIDVFDHHNYQDIPDGDMCTATFEKTTNRMEDIYRITGKPVLIGEFSFTSSDSNLPNTIGARAGNLPACPFATQTQRARAFTRYAKQVMAYPWVVGYHWWQWNDEPMEGRLSGGENSNYGLVTEADDPYHVLTEEMTQTNAEAHEIHEKSHEFWKTS